MIELCLAAYHSIRNRHVRGLEGPNKPDVIVEDPRLGVTLQAECKRLRHTGSPTKRKLSRVLAKANKQLKNLPEGAIGAAVIDVTHPSVRRSTKLEQVPSTVAFYVRWLKELLNGRQYRAISVVVLCWDDYILASDPRETDQYKVMVRRSALEIIHAANPSVVEPPAGFTVFQGFEAKYELRPLRDE